MSQSTHTQEPAHPTPFTYVRVAVILAIITGVEVGLFYVDMAPAAFVGSFFVLSATKFALVAMFYMHLKYDARLFSGLFVGGVLLATVVLVSVLAIYGTLVVNPAKAGEEKALALAAEPTVAPTTAPQVTSTPQATGGPQSSVESGQQLFIAKGCGACHSIEGLPGAVGTLGPAQDDVATRGATRVPGLSAEEYIRQSIEDPQAFVVPGYVIQMLALRATMTDNEFESLVDFLLTLE